MEVRYRLVPNSRRQNPHDFTELVAMDVTSGGFACTPSCFWVTREVRLSMDVGGSARLNGCCL